MSRRARLTVLELGASSIAWASSHGLGADDWVVVAQQSDEPALEFSERVRQRARRLYREEARIEAIDVYAGSNSDAPSSEARRRAIEVLGDQLTSGGRLTLWSATEDARSDAELSAILAHFGPILAKRQIAMNHQACEAEERSGVRHAAPTRSATLDRGLEFEDYP